MDSTVVTSYWTAAIALTVSVVSIVRLLGTSSARQRQLWHIYVSTRNLLRKYLWRATIPESVNYHFTRRCNYSCGFCFHTAKTSFLLPLDDAKRGLRMLAGAGTH